MANDMTSRELARRAEQIKAEVSRVIGDLAEALNSSSDRLTREGDGQLGRWLQNGADHVGGLGSRLKRSGVEEVARDVTRGAGRWARSNPAAVIAGALLVGLAVAHLTGRRTVTDADRATTEESPEASRDAA